MKKVLKISLLVILITILFFLIAFYVYTANYYKADNIAIQTVESLKNNQVETDENMIIFNPSYKTDKAIIFYPGAKVDEIAYYPLMKKLSQNGISCILVKMPFHLAIFDINAAERIHMKFPEIKQWYIGRTFFRWSNG